MFTLNDITLVYDLGKDDVTYALRQINIETPQSGLIGIVGPSGSGKSSLLYIMAGLKEPSSGLLHYNGRTMTNMKIDEKATLRRTDFGFIFQRGYLIEYLSVLDNILVPLNQKTPFYVEKAKNLMVMLGISRLIHKKPNQLSGGQRQRVSIARALMSDPKVIFADEPTAALDHQSAAEVMKVLSEYAKEKLVIVVTHDTTILSEAKKIIQIWDGKLTDEKEV